MLNKFWCNKEYNTYPQYSLPVSKVFDYEKNCYLYTVDCKHSGLSFGLNSPELCARLVIEVVASMLCKVVSYTALEFKYCFHGYLRMRFNPSHQRIEPDGKRNQKQ